MSAQSIVEAVKKAVEDKFAWPGGYPLYILMSDGEAMSVEAAGDNIDLIVMATMAGDRDGWAAAGVDINWEDTNLICCQNNTPIESAYGED